VPRITGLQKPEIAEDLNFNLIETSKRMTNRKTHQDLC
jgi:hypothetical protein